MADRRGRSDGVQSARALLIAGIERARDRGTVDWPVDDELLAEAGEQLKTLCGRDRSRGPMAMNTLVRRFHQGDRYRSAVLESMVKERLVDVDHPMLPDISSEVFPVKPTQGNNLESYAQSAINQAIDNPSRTHLLWEAVNRAATDERARDAVRDAWIKRNQEAELAVRADDPHASPRDVAFLTTAVLIATHGGALVETLDEATSKHRGEAVAQVAAFMVAATLEARKQESGAGPTRIPGEETGGSKEGVDHGIYDDFTTIKAG